MARQSRARVEVGGSMGEKKEKEASCTVGICGMAANGDGRWERRHSACILFVHILGVWFDYHVGWYRMVDTELLFLLYREEGERRGERIGEMRELIER